MMCHSRKKLIAQIAMMDRLVQQQKIQLKTRTHYFTQPRLNHMLLLGMMIGVPFLYLGWKVSGKKWVNKMALGFVDLVIVTTVTYFRRQIMHLLNY